MFARGTVATVTNAALQLDRFLNVSGRNPRRHGVRTVKNYDQPTGERISFCPGSVSKRGPFVFGQQSKCARFCSYIRRKDCCCFVKFAPGVSFAVGDKVGFIFQIRCRYVVEGQAASDLYDAH